MVKYHGSNTFNGTVTAYDILNRSTAETQEDFTISVDPVGVGSDKYVLLLNQVDSDAYGSFTTVEAALSVIPNHVQHTVTISLADGTINLDAVFPFGDMTRFVFIASKAAGAPINMGRIVFSSASGVIIEPDTTTMTVTSGIETSLVLQSDPGFPDDAYRGAFVEVVAGTGVGQIRGIRAHSGVNFVVPARWNPALNSTSQVEIRIPAANMVMPLSAVVIKGSMSTAVGRLGGIKFSNIDVSNATGGSLIINNLVVELGDGSRFRKVGILPHSSSINLGSCIIDGQSETMFGLYFKSTWARSIDTGRAWLIMDHTITGIISYGTSNGYLFQGTVEGCPIGIGLNDPNSSLVINTRVDGVNTNYGVEVKDGATCLISLEGSGPSSITGGTSDFRLDGVDEDTYSELILYGTITGSRYGSKIISRND